jgi:hypothetical protein
MKYILLEDFNDIDYLNESVESDIKLLLERMELPVPSNIPSDGSWSEEITVSSKPVFNNINDLIVKNIEVSVKARIVNDGSNIRAIIDENRLVIWEQDQGSSLYEISMALIDGKWYYEQYDRDTNEK